MPSDPAARPEPSPPRRRRLLTLGGCNALEIAKHLTIAYDHTHIWNVTWPALGSPPFPLIHTPTSPRLSHLGGLIQRETSKSYLDAIARGQFDIILLSAAQNVLNDMVVLGDMCIPDFTALFYLTDEALQGDPRPSIHEFVGNAPRVVTWQDDDFIQVVCAGFSRAYHKVLKPRIDAGATVIIHRHVLATEILTPDGPKADEDPHTARRMALIARLTDFAAGFPGIHILEQIGALNFTSADAIGGKWAFHPIDEQYVCLAMDVARLAGDPIERDILNRFLLERRRFKLGLDREIADGLAREADLEAVSKALAFRAAHAEHEVQAMRRTLSWRVTWPLRAVRRLMRRRTKA
jgi:hypothetical protein